MEVIDIFILEYEKLEYQDKWLRCNCGTRSPAYSYYCCGCGRKIDYIHQETKEEYQERKLLKNS